MGDPIDVEELVAEEEDVGIIQLVIASGLGFVSAYGWYILAAAAAIYFLWKNYGDRIPRPSGPPSQPSAKETEEFVAKETARQKYVAKLQEQYEKEAAARAEKLKLRDDEKRQARLAELEKLTATGTNGSSGHVLGSDDGNSAKSGSKPGKPKSQPLRPEYNPLMGDTSTYSRPCNRQSGRSGG